MERKKKKTPDQLSVFNNALQGQGIGDVGCGPICRVNYLTQRGKTIQLGRILCLIFIPLFGVWGFTIFSLYDNVQGRNDIEAATTSLKIVIRMGRLIHKLQQERDMTILYIGKLGPGTKAFLLKNYEETDEAFTNIEVWPNGFEASPRQEFRSKNKLISYISQHRKYLDPSSTNTLREINFYTEIANQFMTWMIENIRDAGFGSFWKSLVAYQKLIRCSLDAGAERAYGVMFYTYGQFTNWEDFELYNKRVHSFQIHYTSAVAYSPLVDSLLDDEAKEINATLAINRFRAEIRRSEVSISTNQSYKSLEKAEDLFDNMSIRIDSLFELQEQIAAKIFVMLDETVNEIVLQIIIYAVLVCLAVGICPVIIFCTESLTSSIARYSRILVEKSSELDEEKSRSDTILYQMIPKSIAERLKKSSSVDSEFFKSVTLMFSSVVDFTKLSLNFSPMELVDILNYLYTYFDDKIENYDVYKVETINDTYMLASGLPQPNGDKHVSEIAYFAVDVAKMIRHVGFSQSTHGQQLQLLIGISTGPVSAGIIGTAMLRYCVFGDTVNIASRMMSNGAPNRIHISESTYKKLKSTGNFKLQSRGPIHVKGKGRMNTYWLTGILSGDENEEFWNLPGRPEEIRGRASLNSMPAENENAATKFEPEASGSTPLVPRRRSSAATYATTAL